MVCCLVGATLTFPCGLLWGGNNAEDDDYPCVTCGRSNVKEEGDSEQQSFAVQEGDILHVDHKGQERWKVTKVDRTTGKLLSNFQGSIANPER